jgi:hypothetical protein
VTGFLRLNPTAPQAVILGTAVIPNTWPNYPVLRIEAGGQFSAEMLTVAGGTSVGGVLALRRSSLVAAALNAGAVHEALGVDEGGRALLENTLVSGILASALRNAGRVDARHTTFVMQGEYNALGFAVVTTGAGQTVLASSLALGQPLLRISAPDSCSGTPPVSLGYNAAKDTTCALGGPGDVVVPMASWDTDVFGPTFTMPNAGSPMVDAVPPGTNGCGTEVTTDLVGGARPTDSDGDTIAACEIGARERPAA